MKALIILLMAIIIGCDQLEAQIQSPTTKQSKATIEVIFLKPTKHYQDQNFDESSNMGRFVVDNSISDDYIPFKSAFAKKNRFFINRRNAVVQNKMTPSSVSENEIPQTSIYPTQYEKYSKKNVDKLDISSKINKYNVFKAPSKSQKLNLKRNSAEPRMTIQEFIQAMKSKFSLEYSAPNLNNTSTVVEKRGIFDSDEPSTKPKLTRKVSTEVQKLNDKIDFLKFHIFGSNSSEPLKEPKLSLKEFIHEMKYNDTLTDISQNLNSSKVPIEVQKLNDKIDFLKFHIFGSNSSEHLKEPKLSLKEFIHEMKYNDSFTDISQNLNSSKVPIEVQKLNDKIDFLKFHIFGSNSSEPIKEPKLSLEEFIKEMKSNNNLNSSKDSIEVQKLNEKIDFLKFHLSGSTSSEPKLSLKEFMHEMELELNSRRKSTINNFEVTLKNISQEVQKLTKKIDFLKFHLLLSKSPIEDYTQQDIDDSHKDISPSSPNHPKNRISNKLQLPREPYAFVFNYKRIVFNPRRLPLIFKHLIKVPDYLKIPKYHEKVNRSLPKLILPFEKYEKFIQFVETDDKLLPQAITLFFGELPPMPSIPPRSKLHQMEKRSINVKTIILPLINKTIEFRIYNEKNETIYKLHDSYWEQVKAILSIKYSPNNTAKQLEPFLPGFYRGLNFTSNPDDLLPHQIKWLKVFTIDGRWFGPKRHKTIEYRYNFKEYNAERNLNYLLKYFEQMRQDVYKQHLERGAHGLPEPEKSFAFYIPLPDDEEPDFENIIEWGTTLLTPRYHKLYQFNDTYEDVFIVNQETTVSTSEKRMASIEENVIEWGEEPNNSRGIKVSKSRRTKRSEQLIPFGDPGLPPQILLAQAFVNANRGKKIEELPTKFAFPNTINNSLKNEEVTLRKPEVVPNYSKIHKFNVPPSNSDSTTGISFEHVYSFPKYNLDSVLPEQDKPLIQRIIENVKQGRGTFIQRNSHFPRSRFLQKYMNKRKNPLPKGIKKITINYGVPVYLKQVDNTIKPHEVYGPPQPRSKRSTIFEKVFSNDKKSLSQRFYESSRQNNVESRSKIGNDTKPKKLSRSNSPTIIDSKCIVYGFPGLFVKPKKELSLPVDKSKKISKITINYGVPVYMKKYFGSSKSSKSHLNNGPFDLPVTTKSRPFFVSTPEEIRTNSSTTNFSLPVTAKPKPFVASDVEVITLKVPVPNSSKVSEKSGKKSIGESISYSYYLGPNPANITIKHNYYEYVTPTEKPQKVYGVPRIKRSTNLSPNFKSVFGHNHNKTLQQIFLKVPVQTKADEFPTNISSNEGQIQRMSIDQKNIQFSKLISKRVLPKIDEAKPVLVTQPMQPNTSYTNDVQSNRTLTRNLRTSNSNFKVSPGNEKFKIPLEKSSKINDSFNSNNPKTSNNFNTENDDFFYRISLPSSVTRYLKISDNRTVAPRKQNFEPALVSNYFLKNNVTDYQRLHYYLVPNMERSAPFSKSTARTKRSINSMFASVFNNDGSKSLQQRFYEGIQRDMRYRQHKSNYKHSFSHRNAVETASLHKYFVPSLNSVQFAQTPRRNGMRLPRIRVTKYFNNNFERNFNQLPIATKTRPFGKPVAVPIVDKSKLFLPNSPDINKNNFNPPGTVILQVPSFKSVSFVAPSNGINPQISSNEIILNKNKDTKHFANTPATLTLPLVKNERNFYQLPIATKKKHFGEPLADPIANQFPPNSLDNIKTNFNPLGTVILQLPSIKNVSFGNYVVPNSPVSTQIPSRSVTTWPNIKETKYFTNKPASSSSPLEKKFEPNLHQLPNATPFGRPLDVPIVNKPELFLQNSLDNIKNNYSNFNPLGTVILQLPNIKNVSSGNYVAPNSPVNTQIPSRNVMTPKIEVTTYFTNKPATLTSPLEKKFDPNLYQLPNATPFGRPQAVPTENKSKLFSTNSPDSINNHKSWTPKLQIPNTNGKNIFFVDTNATKHLSVTENMIKVTNQPNGVDLPTSNQNITKPDFGVTGPVESYLITQSLVEKNNKSSSSPINVWNQAIGKKEYLKALEDNIKYNAQFSIGTAFNRNFGLPNHSKNHSFEKKLQNLPTEVVSPKNFTQNLQLTKPNSVTKNLPEKINSSEGEFISDKKEQSVTYSDTKNGKIFNQTLETNNTPTNFEEHKINVNLSKHNALEVPKTYTKIGSFIPEDITKGSTNLPRALQEEIKYNSGFKPSKTKNIINVSTNSQISVAIPDSIENDLEIPKTDLKIRNFNPESITKFSAHLPKSSGENKYESHLNPTKTKNRQNLSENSLKVPKEDTVLVNDISNNTTNNLPTVYKPIGNDLETPKTQNSYTENIPNSLTNLPKAIEENIKYNSQFIPTKTDKPTENALRIPKTDSKNSNFKPSQFLVERPKINETISQNAKIPSALQLQMPKIPKGYMFKENAMLWPKVNIIRQNKSFVPVLDNNSKKNIAYSAQPNMSYKNPNVKHYRKPPMNIVVQWLNNATLKSSHSTNKNNNRADIPIEEEISETSQIKNPLYVANRANYPLDKKITIKTNNTRVNIRKNLPNLYNVNSAKSRFIIKNRTLKNNTEDALDNGENAKRKVLIKVIKRPSRKNIVASMLNQDNDVENAK